MLKHLLMGTWQPTIIAICEVVSVIYGMKIICKVACMKQADGNNDQNTKAIHLDVALMAVITIIVGLLVSLSHLFLPKQMYYTISVTAIVIGYLAVTIITKQWT